MMDTEDDVMFEEFREFSPKLPTGITPLSDKSETKEDFPNESLSHSKNSSTKQIHSPAPVFENEMVVIKDLGIEAWDDDDFMPPSSISLLAPLYESKSSSVQPNKPTPIENKTKPLIEYFHKISKESESVQKDSNTKFMTSMDKKTLGNAAIMKAVPRTDVKSSERRYPAVCSIVRSGEISKPRALTHQEGSKLGQTGTSMKPLDGRFVKSHGSDNNKDSSGDVGSALKSSSSASDSKQNISSIQSPFPVISKVQRDISVATTSNATPEFSPQKSGPAPESSVSMKQNLVILVSSRQVSSALEVITALKAKHKVTVDIRTMNVAHFAVSWRVGVIRVTLADFMRFGYWSSLQDTVLELRSLFQLPYIAVENNRANPLASGDDETPFWASHSTGMAGKLRTLGVRLFFSDNKDSTAHILSLLCERERLKGHGIVLPPLQPNVQSVLKFLQALPGVNLALAMKLCLHFTTVATFIKCCNSVASIQQITGVSRDSALLIHDLLSSVSI
ncbi:uncharacterized protein [Anabrus simplex]|uniref:uncharacterized protein n=1 Tax=Anabrus simplex TaxID=316456 RepID=UPI0035A2AB2D